ncbi:MAG: SulP family inorganic anion transporter [Coriobacteriia bacterium]
MVQAVAKKTARKWRFPVLEGILPLDRQRIPTDLIAGATLAALAIPEVMGYTRIAGMPVITGLYTILIPIAVFALLGSSRHLVVGADSATAAIMFAGLAGLSVASESPQWIALASWTALLAAGFLLAARLLKLGFLADFLSRSVLIGFLTGVGIQVALGQIAGMLGVAKVGKGAVSQAVNAILAIPKASIPTVAVSVGVFLVIVGGGLLSKKIPAPLIAVIGAIAVSAWFNLKALGVATLGSVPSGLPKFGLPALPQPHMWAALVTTAGSLFLVILAQSAATSRAYAVKYTDEFDEDVDLVGLSLSNVAAGLSGTFPVNGSPTKTEMVDEAGGRSQISQLTTAVIVLMVLLFFTKPLSFMPSAVLSTVVFIIGVKLVDLKGMKSILAERRDEFWIASFTAAIVVFVGVEQGIFLAMALSVLVHMRHSYRPTNLLMVREGASKELRFSPVDSGTQMLPGVVFYHFGADLYFANAATFAEQVHRIVADAETPVEVVVVDFSAVGDIDFSAAFMLRKLIGALKEQKVTLMLIYVLDPVAKEMELSGLTELIGSENMFGGVAAAVAALKERDGEQPPH